MLIPIFHEWLGHGKESFYSEKAVCSSASVSSYIQKNPPERFQVLSSSSFCHKCKLPHKSPSSCLGISIQTQTIQTHVKLIMWVPSKISVHTFICPMPHVCILHWSAAYSNHLNVNKPICLLSGWTCTLSGHVTAIDVAAPLSFFLSFSLFPFLFSFVVKKDFDDVIIYLVRFAMQLLLGGCQ